jgi:subtilisin-like proprotein convertase family protein
VLDNLDGEQASGVWTVRISDNAGGDDGHIMEVGLPLQLTCHKLILLITAEKLM